MKTRKHLKSGQRVSTPDGNGEIFEVSRYLHAVSVFLDGERKSRYYGKDEVKPIST